MRSSVVTVSTVKPRPEPKGKAVACVAAALGELRVEIDVDAKFGGLAEEGEIAGIVRCGVSVIRVGVP